MMNLRNFLIALFVAFFIFESFSQSVTSKSWVADLGNGKYKNPILYSDYSDPDICVVGDDYYMTASSFNCIPGLPILHSKDLVNWSLIGHALDKLVPEEEFSKPQHGNGVWAPAIRYHDGEFYIYYGDPDYGVYMLKAKDPAGKWSEPVLVKSGKGLIDSCPLWDDDGKVYLVHAYAGSRAGIKSILTIAEMNAEGTQTITPSQVVYDGHGIDPTIEGPKFYKRNGYYYIFAPAGGVSTGWQVVLRSKNVYGPYERKVVMAQKGSNVNGPHQGGWIATPEGEDWFIHFQDDGAFGRIVHLQPTEWKNDWPIIGIDKDGDGVGEPVSVYTKPKTSQKFPIATPAESDWFESRQLGLQWQWHANPMDWWLYLNQEAKTLSLYSVPVPKDYKSLWDIPNLLLQKFPSNRFTVTTKFTFHPSEAITGERAGLVVMGMDYASLIIEKTDNGFVLLQNECKNADKGSSETVNETVTTNETTLYFRVSVTPDAKCVFSYSINGRKFIEIGNSFTAREGKWIGAKVGLFCSRPISNNDGGRAEFDWFVIEK